MCEKEPPKAPEGRFQLGLHSFFKPPPPLTAEEQKQKQDAAAAKHKQLVEQQRANAQQRVEELQKNKLQQQRTSKTRGGDLGAALRTARKARGRGGAVSRRERAVGVRQRRAVGMRRGRVVGRRMKRRRRGKVMRAWTRICAVRARTVQKICFDLWST